MRLLWFSSVTLAVSTLVSAASVTNLNSPVNVEKRDDASAAAPRARIVRPWIERNSDPSSQRPRKKGFAVRNSTPSNIPANHGSHPHPGKVEPIKVTGKIEVRYASNHSKILGYVGPYEKNVFGEYGIVNIDNKTECERALVVSFEPTITLSAPGNLYVDTTAVYPNFGAITAETWKYGNYSSNLGPGSPGFVSFGDVESTEPLGVFEEYDNSYKDAVELSKKPGDAKSAVESAIWSYNATSGKLTPTWINEDSTPALNTSLVLVESKKARNSLKLTGDLDLFEKQFGSFKGPLELYFVKF